MAYTTINKPSSYFNTVLYTGDDTTNRSITGVGFKPDWTWIKSRSNAYYHELYDAVRGFSSTTNGRVLYSNTTGAEGTPNTFNSFNTDGFTVSKQTGEVGTNGTGATYVAWNWLAANSTTSNTSGTITSTVSANTTSGFSIVSYTGNGSAGATVGHGLGAAPKMMIHKDRTTAGYQWGIYTSALGATKNLNFTTGGENVATTYYNDTAPTSTVFSLGTNVGYNANGDNYIAYCFAEIKGFSKFGSYTGNKLDDGPFVYTGFKPAWIMFKNTVRTDQNWVLQDNKINTYNGAYNFLVPNSNIAQASGSSVMVDFLSNGFKMRGSDDATNDDVLMIYAAFAENPFVSSTFIPTTAR